jgi:S-adenosylmethionine decarboxylase
LENILALSAKKLQLYGFNNLTKNFSCSAYLINYVTNQKSYRKYLDDNFATKQLSTLLTALANKIGAQVLNIAQQEYHPQGSSVTLLIADSCTPSIIGNDAIVGHLDKSHICVHTYPESHPTNNINTLRIDFEVSTCGVISPLKALNFILEALDADILNLDYRIRGFTRKTGGEKLYLDHNISSIQEFINDKNHQLYDMLDANMSENNLFSSKLIKKNFTLAADFFNSDMLNDGKKAILQLLAQERREIFYGENL